MCEDFADELISCDKNDCPDLYQFQDHHHTHTCYRNERDKINKFCRFDLPMFPFDRTKILTPLDSSNCSTCAEDVELAKKMKSFLRDEPETDQDKMLETFKLSYSSYERIVRCSLQRTKLFIKRKKGCLMINNFNPMILKIHRSNMDIQLILDAYAVCAYVVNYINKSSKSMSKLLRHVAEQAKSNDSSNLEKLRKISYAFLDSQEVSVQEAVYMMLSMQFKKSSCGTVFVASFPKADRHRLLKTISEIEENPEEIFVENIFEQYEKRPRSLENITLAEFATEYENDRKVQISDQEDVNTDIGQYRERKNRKILRFVNYRKHLDYENFCREQNLLFRPWRSEDDEICGANNIENFVKYEVKITETRKKFFALDDDVLEDNLIQIEEKDNDTSMKIDGDVIEDDDFVLAMNPRITQSEVPRDEKVKEDNVKILSSPKLVPEETFKEIISSLNDRQRDYLYHVVSLYNKSETFYHFLSGAAGVGKSLLIKAIFQTICRLANKRCERTDTIKVLLTASTGKAAFNIEGDTIHHAFSLPVNQYGGKLSQLSDSITNTIACQLFDLELIILDEISMVGTRTLSYIDQRLRQLKKTENIFGGIPVIVVGDFKQLPPVGDCPVFQADPKDPYSFIVDKTDAMLWRRFKMYELTEIMRQKDDLRFAETLTRLGNNELSALDIKLLNTRVQNSDTTSNHVHLFYTNTEVSNYNQVKLEYLNTESFLSISHDRIIGAKSQKELTSLKKLLDSKKTSETYGLPSKILMKLEARYVITVNIDTSDGLTNGCTGMFKCSIPKVLEYIISKGLEYS